MNYFITPLSLDKFIMFSLYFTSVTIFFNFNSPIIFWFWLEFNMVLFLGCMATCKFSLSEIDIFSQCLYYFILQSFASIFLLLMFSTELFSFKGVVMMMVIFMKLGIFPFHFWIYKISEYLSSVNLFFILNLQKIPLLLFMTTYHFEHILTVLLLNMLFGCLFLMNSSNITELLVSSSICFFNWLFFILMWSVMGFILFFFKYLVFNTIFLNIKKFCNVSEMSSNFFFKVLFLISFLMGLPPFIYFFFKIFIVSVMIQFSTFTFMFFIWLFSYLCLVSYFNMLMFYLFKWKNNYSYSEYYSKMEYSMLVFVLLSFFLYT